MAAVADQGHDLTLPEPASTPDSVSMTIPFGVLIGLGRFAERSSPARSGDGAGASKSSFGYWRRAWPQDRRPLWFAGCTELAAVSFYTWRQKFRTGELTGLAPVTLASLVGQLPTAATPVDPMWTLPVADQPAGGRDDRGGAALRVKLRLTGAVDEAALHRVDRQRVVTVALKK